MIFFFSFPTLLKNLTISLFSLYITLSVKCKTLAVLPSKVSKDISLVLVRQVFDKSASSTVKSFTKGFCWKTPFHLFHFSPFSKFKKKKLKEKPFFSLQDIVKGKPFKKNFLEILI